MKGFLVHLGLLFLAGSVAAGAPPFTDYCERLAQEIQGRKHGFLAGNVSYYIGGFHASWRPVEDETMGLTHPFYHDLRGRGVGLLESRIDGSENTGVGNDYVGWEFYKDTRVLYGSVIVNGQTYRHPKPIRMVWRPDKMICEYEVGDVRLREKKFIGANDAAASMITASRPVTLRFEGKSFFVRESVASSAAIRFDGTANAIVITEGGTTRSRPDPDRPERVGPIVYQGMTTVLSASRDFSRSHQFSEGKNGEQLYSFEIPCDSEGVTVAWAMHDDSLRAIRDVRTIIAQAPQMLVAKTAEMNRQLNEEVPWFRCSDRKFEDIYYYLWSLYLMCYIDVQKGWEMENHTQTAVNNFLGMHRYDATFQIKVGAWLADKPRYAYGNVLTWKHLIEHGRYKRHPDGAIAVSDNKGTTWHSGAYGLELSEHVLGAWQIYQHSGDVNFLRNCYKGYFKTVFWGRIPSFFMNEFEVAETLIEMAKLTGHPEDVAHWQSLVRLDPADIRRVFDQGWQANGHTNLFAGPKNGMLMTTSFWPMRSKYFPREYAEKMVKAWALDREDGFFGEFFPLAMSRKAMKDFNTKADQSFGYTPDTAYFTLSGMFRQHLGEDAWQLTLNHLENYNYHREWNMPVAPEAYRRDGKLFGDEYSNFNAGKILLFLEGLAGLEYSIPSQRFTVCDTMPAIWDWMEFRVPIRTAKDKKTIWVQVRFDRKAQGETVRKTVAVSNCPFPVTIEAWLEGKQPVAAARASGEKATLHATPAPGYAGFNFQTPVNQAAVEVTLPSVGGPSVHRDVP